MFNKSYKIITTCRLNKLMFVALLFIVFNCKTLSILPESQTKTIESLVLGSIGSGKSFILQKGFNDASYPSYTKPIKVSVLKTPFKVIPGPEIFSLYPKPPPKDICACICK